MAVSFKGTHFPPEIILMGVRWYLAYPLSTRHVEELMEERGVHADHSTVNRWVIKSSPQLEIYQSCNLHKTLCQPKNRLRDCHTV
jgi:putative transposase